MEYSYHSRRKTMPITCYCGKEFNSFDFFLQHQIKAHDIDMADYVAIGRYSKLTVNEIIDIRCEYQRMLESSPSISKNKIYHILAKQYRTTPTTIHYRVDQHFRDQRRLHSSKQYESNTQEPIRTSMSSSVSNANQR